MMAMCYPVGAFGKFIDRQTMESSFSLTVEQLRFNCNTLDADEPCVLFARNNLPKFAGQLNGANRDSDIRLLLVTKLESLEARNRATVAISSGRPISPRGIWDLKNSLASSPRGSRIGVSIVQNVRIQLGLCLTGAG